MTFRSSSQVAPGSGVTNAAVPVPTGAAIGDIAVVGIYIEFTSSITPPSGFTLKAALNTSAGSRGSLHVFWKRLTAADTGTYSFTWTGASFAAGTCALFSGRVASGDPFDGTVGTAESTTGVTTLNVSTSPVGANGDAVGFWTNFNGGSGFTAPTGYTQQQVAAFVIALETRDAVAAGSTGNVSATATITDFMKAFLGVLAIASSGTTGTIAVTQAPQTSSATGQLGYSGTIARTQGAQTSSASGTVVNPVTGTIAVTQAAQTATTTGQLGYSGSIARTQGPQIGSATGQLGYSGSIAATQAAETGNASGTVSNPGSFTGTIAVVQAPETSAATGTVINPVTGTIAVIQGNQAGSATGRLGYSGAIATVESLDLLVAVGSVSGPVTGTIAVLQAPQIGHAVGGFSPLVTFGTAGAGDGKAASASGATGSAPKASAGSMTVPIATGG